ncbi:hypothetical protein SAMN05446935_6334 [Burkholderia sp. YR290]|nr:hypothetical protein SAMN05446934_6690 [Paraburkholderia hospita]SOE85858.1 hypothetical protein SAMN05446935_6334 [Burkholderia sp. YR290]
MPDGTFQKVKAIIPCDQMGLAPSRQPFDAY